MLREGWDVQNVTTIVGLRSYSATNKILPEQTLGRGLRRMFRGKDINEEPKLSVIGTQAFIDFVKSIKTEGVDLDYKPMGEQTPAKAPLLIEIDKAKLEKNNLDITLPLLTPRMHRNWKNLEELDVNAMQFNVIQLKLYSEEEKRQIVFIEIMTDEVSAISEIPSEIVPDYHRALHFFTQNIMRDLRLSSGNEIVFGKLKQFIEARLFGQRVDLNDLNVLRNLSEQSTRRMIIETFKQAINNLTVNDRGTSEIKDMIKISKTRPFLVKEDDYIEPKKCMFNKIVGDSKFELDFAYFLDGCDDIMSYVKNNLTIGFYVDYRNEEGSIANYYPDFIVKKSEEEIWIIELKGVEDLNTANKRQRLEQYCLDATEQEKNNRIFHSLYIKQEDWKRYTPRNFGGLIKTFS
jgi:type III restriction enzyme